MNLASKVSIEEFVEKALAVPHARKIMDDWPIETVVVKQIIVRYFYSMGIYKVVPLRSSILAYDNVVFMLKNSPEIYTLIRKEKEAQDDSRKRVSPI